MREHTPTTDEVREYIRAADRVTAHMFAPGADSVEAFDRWLADHDAEVRARAFTEAAGVARNYDTGYDTTAATIAEALTDAAAWRTARAGVVAEEPEPSAQVKQLLRDMTDPDDCWFDHHGGCQAHGYLSLQPGEKCPHAQAKELLAAWVPVKQEGVG